jgi:hypothetical protein
MENEDTTPQGVSSADATLAAALGGLPTEPSQEEHTQPESAETQAGADQPQGGDGEQPDGAAVDSLDALAQQLEVPMDELLGLKVKLKVDGEEKDATLAELIKINQLEGHVNRKSIELSEKQKAWEQEQGQVRQEWSQRMSFAGQALDSQEQQLAQQFNSINWPALQAQDPGQYSALYLQFQQAANQLAGQKAALQQHFVQTQQQIRESVRPKAVEAIRAQNPDLVDPASYGNALAEMKSYLKGVGTSEAQFDALELDPTIFHIVRDAMRYSAIAAQRPGVEKKVANAPKFEKPSTRDGAHNRSKATYDRAIRGDEDAMAALLAS